jgi:hypothetical protein
LEPLWRTLDQERYNVTSVRIYESFSNLPSSYDALFEHGAKKSIYLSRDWFELIFRTCSAPGDAPRIYGLEQEDGTPEPIAALVMRGNSTHKSLSSGRVLQSMSNWYSGIYSPLLAAKLDDPTDAVRQLFSAVMRDNPAWDRIEMSPLDPDDSIYTISIEALRRNRMLPQTYRYSGDWYERLEGTNFDDYWRSLSSKKRNTLRRKEKAAQAADNIQFRMYTDETDLDRALRDYLAIYADSWKGVEVFKDFIPELIRRAARLKILRLGIVYVAGEPAAVELCIAFKGVAVMAKTAYVAKFAELSVGTVATLRVLQRVLDEDKIHEIDFGNGDDAYKHEWVRSRRERWGLIGYNVRTLHGLLGAGWNIGGRAAKAKIQKIMNIKRGEDGLAVG